MTAQLQLIEPEVLLERLRKVHSPLPVGEIRPNPYRPGDRQRQQVCGGCGGVMFWPCATRMLLDGQEPPENPEPDPEPFGSLPSPRGRLV